MPKLLGEFLHERQEPFSLDLYLLERGYSRQFTCTCNNFAKSSKRLLIKTPNKRPRSVLNCTEFVKAVFGRLVLHCHSWKVKNSGNGSRKNGFQENRGEDEDDAHVLNSCSENGSPLEEEVGADSESRRRSIECCNEQLSPVSVLDKIESNERSPLHHDKQYNSKTTTQEDSSNSILKPKPHPTNSSSLLELENLVGTFSYSQYVINTRALEKSKQLLIDCMREVIEIHRRRDKDRHYLKQILDADELWRLICENVWKWSQESVDVTNIIQLLHYDLLASVEEWSVDYEQKKEEISMEIGDVILEGIIDEVVVGLSEIFVA